MVVANTLAVIALLVACGSIAFSFLRSPSETARRVASIEVELQEAIETMSRWMKRENVRRAREAKEESADAPRVPPFLLDSARHKAQLRERARNKGLM